MQAVKERSLVCVQGLGFVGTAMAVAVASARNEQGEALYSVVGIDLPNPLGTHRVQSINDSTFPFETTDEKLKTNLERSVKEGHLSASFDESHYERADIIIVDIPLDLYLEDDTDTIDVNFGPFRGAIRTLGQKMKPDCLVIVETTVPPGTCEHVVLPILKECFTQRGLDPSEIRLAHSYERVMPGRDYLDSIINFWRVFSGIDERSASLCEDFLKDIINTEEYPLTRLSKTVASETAKVLENSYRATTIAFMEEWGRFAEEVGFDLFQVIRAIRMRPTHSNIRQPGFGVGGYCLTKDPLFAQWSSQNFFDKPLDFPFCMQAVKKNKAMPIVTLDAVKTLLDAPLQGKKILLLGVSYRQDVGDTRYSPSGTFLTAAQKEGAHVICHDPLVDLWEEFDIRVESELPSVDDVDIIVLAVPHQEYKTLDLVQWLGDKKLPVIDANCVLSDEQRLAYIAKGGTLFSIGRGAQL